MDKAKCIKIRSAIAGIFASVEKEFGVKVAVGHASFTPDNATFKVEFADVAADGTVITHEASNLKALGFSYGIPADSLGRKFTDRRGRTFVVAGLAPRSHRYPVLATCEQDGKTYKFPARAVREYLDKARVPGDHATLSK
jgi:hypothetical protein